MNTSTSDLPPRRTKTPALVQRLKSESQDFEWYPTTNEILDAVVKYVQTNMAYSSPRDILDVGAGNGKALEYLGKHLDRYSRLNLYAIEKSTTLVSQLPSDIQVIGSDFHEQSFYNKEQFTFCNPPYSEYAEWMTKLLNESPATLVFVVPTRWAQNEKIQRAIASREWKYETIGTFDFISSEDRAARAVVDVLIFSPNRKHDAFDSLFDSLFESELSEIAQIKESQESEEERCREIHLHNVAHRGLVDTLVGEYQNTMQKLVKNIQAALKLDIELLHSLGINVPNIRSILRTKLDDTKADYWKRLFDEAPELTKRLTSKNRRELLEKINRQNKTDFNKGNILNIFIWAINNANQMQDSQLIQVYDRLLDSCNVDFYKSNQATILKKDWGFRRELEDKEAKYFLLTRVVSSVGGVHNSPWKHESRNGLNERTSDFLKDMCVLAGNLGFSGITDLDTLPEWSSGKTQTIKANYDGKEVTLFEVKSFKKQTTHIKLNVEFSRRLNVEYGRLKGWLKSPADAVREFSGECALTIEQAESAFKSYKGIEITTALPALGYNNQ